MSISFFIVGAIIFSIYLFFMFYNIIYSNKKQREENYPNLDGKVEAKKNDSSS